MAQNSNVSRSQEDYITQVSEEIEGRVTQKLSKEFSRTENRLLSALARLDDYLMNPLIQGHSGITPETCRNAFSTNQGTNEDDSQSDPHPEAGTFDNQMTQNSGPEDGRDMVTGATERNRNRRDMMTRATEQIRNRHDMVTGAAEHIRTRYDMRGIHEEFTYCSPSTSSEKQRKNRFTSQRQFRSESTPATIEADQILLALQQLANNNNSAIFPNNINRISNFPKSLTTTMPTFDGNSESSSCLKIFSKPVSNFIIS